MPDLNDMYFFAKVVEYGGYSAASRHLGVQTSMLSRRIAELEQRLGVRLLNRTTRRISLTAAGETFHSHCMSLVGIADAAHEAIEQTRSEPRGLVRVSCPAGLLHSHVATIATQFLHDNPLVRLHIEASNRRVDVVEERFDLALRVRTPPLDDSDLAIRRFGETDTMLVGCPSLWQGKPVPSTLEELSALPTLAMTDSTHKQVWQFLDASKKPLLFSHVPRLTVDDFQSLHIAVLGGLGVAWLPEITVRADMRAGRLVRVMPQLALPRGIVHAVFPSRRGMVPAVRNFLDALVDGFANAPGAVADFLVRPPSA